MRRLLVLIICIHVLFMAAPAFADEPAPAELPVLRSGMIRTARTYTLTPLHPDLPARYAQLRYRVPVYKTLDDAYADRPHRWLSARDTWLGLYEIAPFGTNVYYRSTHGWVADDALDFADPSELHGIDPREYDGDRIGLVYWPVAIVVSEPNGSETVDTLAGYDVVSIYEQQPAAGAAWYRIGDSRWIHSKYVRLVTPGLRPARVGENEKWIEVDLSEQMVIAHEGDTPVYATLSATGLPPRWTTVRGLYRIWVKVDAIRMYGGASPADEYRLEDVPWTMFFYQDYGLHGTYWHDAFGAPRSHGCVNLSPADSRWFFEWAEPALPANTDHILSSDENPGTWVWVHD